MMLMLLLCTFEKSDIQDVTLQVLEVSLLDRCHYKSVLLTADLLTENLASMSEIHECSSVCHQNKNRVMYKKFSHVEDPACDRQALTKRKLTVCRYGINKLTLYVNTQEGKKKKIQLPTRN